jgi:transposase
VSHQTAYKWCRRADEAAPDALHDRASTPHHSPQRLVRFRRRQIEKRSHDARVQAQRCRQWSTQSLAKKLGLSQRNVSRMRRAFGLQPHRVETLKRSTGPQFIEKVRDIVGLYRDPPDRALVPCIDGKSQIQALDRIQPLPPMRLGQMERRTHDDVRHGTVSLFAALDAKSSEVIRLGEARHRSLEFRRFLGQIDRSVPADLDVHLILDNYGTHKTATIRRWLAKRPRYHVHFTSTSASWLNMVERWFGELTRQQLQHSAHQSTDALETAILGYLAHTNKHPKPFVWTKTADEILESVKHFCQRTSDSGR